MIIRLSTFSIDKKEKYDINNDVNYYTNPTYYYYDDDSKSGNKYFKFGNNIKIYDNCIMNSNNCVSYSKIYKNSNPKINGDEVHFIVESFKAYQSEYKLE